MNLTILDKISMLGSGVLRGLGVAAIPVLVLLVKHVSSLFGYQIDPEKLSATAQADLDAVLTFITAAGLFYAAWKRITGPNPPLTEKAIEKTQQMVETGKLSTTKVEIAPPPNQVGRSLLSLLFCLSLTLGLPTIVVFVATGCTTTVINTMSQEAKLKAIIDATKDIVLLVDRANRTHVIPLEDATRFREQAKTGREYLAVAEQVIYSDPKKSRDLTELGTVTLQSLEKYLLSQGATYE